MFFLIDYLGGGKYCPSLKIKNKICGAIKPIGRLNESSIECSLKILHRYIISAA